MNRLKFLLTQIPQLALHLALGVGSLKLESIVAVLNGSVQCAVISGLLFFVVATVAHRQGRTRSLKWRITVYLVIYLFKILPATVESIVVHHPEIVYAETMYKPLQSDATEAKSVAQPPPKCESLDLAQDLLFLVAVRPIDILLAIFITWCANVAIDVLALFLDYLSYVSKV